MAHSASSCLPPPMRVVLDANVLYSETLTDVFVALAAADLVAVVWSNRLRAEWELALARNRPEIAPDWLAQRCQDLEAAANWTCIDVDEAVAMRVQLPDDDDRHVLAAAIQSGATAIVTSNLCDFPRRTLEAYGVCAMTADACLLQLLTCEAARTIAALPAAVARATSTETAAYLERLRRAGLARSVKVMRTAALGQP